MADNLQVTGGGYSFTGRIEVDVDTLERLGRLCQSFQADLDATASTLAQGWRDTLGEVARTALHSPVTAFRVEEYLGSGALHTFVRDHDTKDLGAAVTQAAQAYRSADRGIDAAWGYVVDQVDRYAPFVLIAAGLWEGARRVVPAYARAEMHAITDRELLGVAGRDALHTFIPIGAFLVTDAERRRVYGNAKARFAKDVNHAFPSQEEMVTWIFSHGELTSHAVNGVTQWAGQAGFIAGLAMGKPDNALKWSTTAGLLQAIAAPYPDRPAVISPRLPLASAPTPTGIGPLMRTLEPVVDPVGKAGGPPNPLSDPTSTPGRVDIRVRTWTDSTGHVRKSCLVTIPGTTKWPMPWDQSQPDIRDTLGNIRARAGLPTAESIAIAKIIKEQVPAGADVCLVGHSQGGLTAYQLANDASVREHCNITHVVTAGTPTQGMPIPDGIKTLGLENDQDCVWALDGKDQRGTRDHITARFHGLTHAGMFAGHAATEYVTGGHQVDDRIAEARSGTDRSDGALSLQEFDAGMRAHGYLADGPTDPSKTTSMRFDLNRQVVAAG